MATKAKMNVQSFPRPPLLEKVPRHIKVTFNGKDIADTEDAYWVLETHHPPSTHIHSLPMMDCVLNLRFCSVLSTSICVQGPADAYQPQDVLRMEGRRNLLQD